MYKEFRMGGNNNPFGFIGPLLILAGFFAVLFLIARGVFKLLYFIGPVLLIIAIILDYKAVIEFLQSAWNLLVKNPLMGIMAIVLGIVFWPVLTGYIFFKALGRRKLKKVLDTMEQERNSYTEYEEVVEDDSFLQLPELNKPKENPIYRDNKYDQLF